MPALPARRKFGRFTPKPAATLSLNCAGRYLGDLRIVDLSAGGCQVALPKDFQPAPGLLEQVEIHHPLLPPVALRGVLVHRSRQGLGGIEFLSVPKDLYFLLQGMARTRREH